MNITYTIRKEEPTDWLAAEYMTKKAFWNLHSPGCDEHYLVHLLRTDNAYVPELTRVAECDGQIIGAIYYSKAYIDDGTKKHEVLTFGPLCVEPSFQKQGVGGSLLSKTLALAKQSGHRAVIIFGEPDYYPRFGFKTCDNFEITTINGKNIDAFMGIELIPAGLNGITGKFLLSDVFEHLNSHDAEVYDKLFPYMEKLILPGQWDTPPDI
jgi:predicted N-acetyltransferase YhbS